MLGISSSSHGMMTYANGECLFKRSRTVNCILIFLRFSLARPSPVFVPERHIESDPIRLEAGIVADCAGQCTAAHGATSRRALEVDIGRRGGLRVIIVRLVVHKSGDAVGVVAPAQTCPIDH